MPRRTHDTAAATGAAGRLAAPLKALRALIALHTVARIHSRGTSLDTSSTFCAAQGSAVRGDFWWWRQNRCVHVTCSLPRRKRHTARIPCRIARHKQRAWTLTSRKHRQCPHQQKQPLLSHITQLVFLLRRSTATIMSIPQFDHARDVAKRFFCKAFGCAFGECRFASSACSFQCGSPYARCRSLSDSSCMDGSV